MNKNCSNLEREIRRCLILLDLSDGFLDESRFTEMLRNEMKDMAEEIQPYLDNLPLLSDFLTDYELMDLEFIDAFGIYEFIEALDNACTIEAFLDLCALICEAIEISTLDSSYFSYSKDNKRAKRRALDVRTRTRMIQLGSCAIYSEDGKLVRSEGIACKKCIKKLYEASQTPWTKAKFEAAHKIYTRTRHLTRLAEAYNDYTILYRGRYFKDTSKDIQLPDVLENTPVKKGKEDVFFVRLPEESAGYEYRYSGQYVKSHGDVLEDEGDSAELHPSEKDNVPMSIRRNKHYAISTPSSEKPIDKANMLPISTCEIPLLPFTATSNRSNGFL